MPLPHNRTRNNLTLKTMCNKTHKILHNFSMLRELIFPKTSSPKISRLKNDKFEVKKNAHKIVSSSKISFNVSFIRTYERTFFCPSMEIGLIWGYMNILSNYLWKWTKSHNFLYCLCSMNLQIFLCDIN